MAVNVTMELMRTLAAQLGPQVKVESCQVADARRCSRRCDADAVATYRVHVTGVAMQDAATPTPWTRALLLKWLPSPPEAASDAQRWLRNETTIHTRALPALMRFQAERRVQTPFSGAASCVATRAGRLLALDDADARGFHPASGAATLGLDADHCDAALGELARLHALSLAMRRLRPAAFKMAVEDCVKEAVFLPESAPAHLPRCRSITQHAFSLLAGKAATPTNEAEERRYLEHFQRFVDEPEAFFGRMAELAAPREPLSVLCHGACVPENILFKYDDHGKVEEVGLKSILPLLSSYADINFVCFVEFTTARFASLALDVATLVCCGTSHALRAQRLPRMLAEYHRALVTQLQELLQKPLQEFRLEDDPLEPHALWLGLQSEFRRCCRFGLGLEMDATDGAPRFVSVTMPSCGHAKDDDTPRRRSEDLDTELRRRKLIELVQELIDNGDL